MISTRNSLALFQKSSEGRVLAVHNGRPTLAIGSVFMLVLTGIVHVIGSVFMLALTGIVHVIVVSNQCISFIFRRGNSKRVFRWE